MNIFFFSFILLLPLQYSIHYIVFFNSNLTYFIQRRLIHHLRVLCVSYPGKGECADPVNKDAILEEEGGGESPGRNRERQLASDTGGGKT